MQGASLLRTCTTLPGCLLRSPQATCAHRLRAAHCTFSHLRARQWISREVVRLDTLLQHTRLSIKAGVFALQEDGSGARTKRRTPHTFWP